MFELMSKETMYISSKNGRREHHQGSLWRTATINLKQVVIYTKSPWLVTRAPWHTALVNTSTTCIGRKGRASHRSKSPGSSSAKSDMTRLLSPLRKLKAMYALQCATVHRTVWICAILPSTLCMLQ